MYFYHEGHEDREDMTVSHAADFIIFMYFMVISSLLVLSFILPLQNQRYLLTYGSFFLRKHLAQGYSSQ